MGSIVTVGLDYKNIYFKIQQVIAPCLCRVLKILN